MTTLRDSIDYSLCRFNPHTHEGCDPSLSSNCLTMPRFNPHTHEGCDRWQVSTFSHSTSFNPHTHEGCDSIASFYRERQEVSIHTPTKGVTLLLPYINLLLRVSIHTPTKGVTSPSLQSQSRHCSFNPHTHEGCDVLFLISKASDLVSIHTPTKGVTLLSMRPTTRQRFQSTHPRRV